MQLIQIIIFLFITMDSINLNNHSIASKFFMKVPYLEFCFTHTSSICILGDFFKDLYLILPFLIKQINKRNPLQLKINLIFNFFNFKLSPHPY